MCQGFLNMFDLKKHLPIQLYFYFYLRNKCKKFYLMTVLLIDIILKVEFYQTNIYQMTC